MVLLNKSSLLSMAVAAALPAIVLLGWSAPARAQFQDTTGGHALDANNRIGSGGYNGASTPHDNYNVNNNVVNGNVSGLNYFHGNRTTEFDPNVFQGNTGSSSFDNFNAVSSPVNINARTTGQPNYVPFYASGSIVGTPPANYVTTPGGTGYIPAPVVSALTPTGYDARIDQTSIDPTKGNLLPQGQLNVAGPVDPSSGTASVYSMSPLYGVQANNGPANQSTVLNSQTTNTLTLSKANKSTMTPADIQRMRDELNSTVVPADQSNQNTSGQNGQPNGQQGANQSSNGQPAAGQSNAGQTGANQSLSNQAITPGNVNLGQSQQLSTLAPPTNNLAADQSLGSSIPNAQLGTSLNSGQGLQNQLIIAPAKQSKQLAELEKRYARDNTKPNDVIATERLNAEMRAQSAGQNPNTAAAKPGKGDGGTAPSATDLPKLTPQPILTKPDMTEDSQPYIVSSLATGITAKGLAQLMKTAEDQMRQGKFTEAVDTYDTAEEVAPNNPFVALGRGFAEMGASYYGKADQDLTRAFNTDPAVLIGHYDLKGFLGEDRLKFVHDDLEDIANQEKGARPLILLGFIAHNNGDDALATKDLAEAERRGGYADLIKTMRQAWGLK